MPSDQVIDQNVIRRSVQADELRQAATMRESYVVWWGSFLQQPLITLPVDPPIYWTRQRDEVLFSTLQHEDKWANAVAIAATKCASMEWEVDGDVPLRSRRIHELLSTVDGMQGWSQFVAKHMQDYLGTDNGAFIEIVRESRALGSRIAGLLHLDSRRCVRTGDPQVPVLYVDKLGGVHELRAHQVIAIADMPTPRLTFNGVGYCAASRAYNTIYRMAVIERYIAEKVSGRKPLSLHLLTNISDKQIKDIIASAEGETKAKGLTSYMGVALGATNADQEIADTEIQLAGLPENFDLEKERSNARLEYANTIGLDIQDLQPGAIGGSLGSATQSQVLDTKAKGKGLAYWRKAITEQLNLKVLPDATTFMFIERDYRDEIQKADAALKRTQVRSAMIANGEIDAPKSQQMAVDSGDMPKEFLPEDITPDTTLASDEKPEDETETTDTTPTTDPAQAAPTDEAQPAPVNQSPASSPAEALMNALKERMTAVLKANRVELASIAPQFTRPKFPKAGEPSYLQRATAALDDYLQTLVAALKEECPVSDGDGAGALRDSIRYEIRGRNTRNATGYVYAGSKERPEVAVRSVLYGRRGFGPRRAKVLAFPGGDGKTVFTMHVAGTGPNDFFKRAWDRTAKERADMARRIGALEAEQIKASDVPLANVPSIDGYNPRRGETVPNTVTNRRRGGVDV